MEIFNRSENIMRILTVNNFLTQCQFYINETFFWQKSELTITGNIIQSLIVYKAKWQWQGGGE